MTKRLCDLVELIENNKDYALLAVKEGVKPIDLIRLGFNGTETMFRASKDSRTVGITIFHDSGRSLTMNVGASNTIVGADLQKMRHQIIEAFTLDWGITLGGNSSVRGNASFRHWVEKTSGPRDLDSLRNVEIIEAPGGDCSMFVNGQHIAHVHENELHQWLDEKNILMVRWALDEPAGNGCTVVKGEFHRLETDRKIGLIMNGVVYPASTSQGLVYKDGAAFEKGEGVCYIPEYGMDREDLTPSGGFPLELCEAYTYDDILRACEGNEEAAKQVFAGLEWQHPETLYQESRTDFAPQASHTPQADALAFSDALDKAFDSFLTKTGWRGLDSATAVGEFVRFAKQDMKPSLDDLMKEAKDKAKEKNAGYPEAPKGRKPPEMER